MNSQMNYALDSPIYKVRRVLQLGKFYPLKGGVEKVMYDLMLGLSEKEVDCDMLCAHLSRDSRRVKLNRRAQVICSGSWGKVFGTMITPSMVLTLWKECAQYDIIHVHCPDPMAVFALFCSKYKGRVVVHWHSDIVKQKNLLKLYLPLQKWLLRRADRIVCTSPVLVSDSPYLREWSDKITVIPIGVSGLNNDNAIYSALKIKEQFDCSKIIFALGRLVEYKGFSYLVDAAKYLPDDYQVVIGGQGPLYKELASQIFREKLDHKVHLMGFIAKDQLPAFFHACDVFCLSSIYRTEAFGIVQIEAMSCGKPVVATTIPGSGVSWVNEHGVSGLNVEPCNPKALADAIVEITADEERYARFSHGAKERFNKMFTKDKMIESCLELYNELSE